MKVIYLFTFTCIIALTFSISVKSAEVAKNIPGEAPLPAIVVIVPWSVDTLRIACASDIPPIIEPTVSSSCGMDDTTRSITTFFGSCINERTIVRTWYYTDLCADDTLVRQVIIVLDTIPPVVTRTWAEDTSYLDCLSEVPPLQYPTVTDNCGIKDTIRSIETHFGSCINDRTIKRTFLFRDSCDNQGRIVQMIYVKDTIPPVVTRTWAEDTSYLDCRSEIPPIQWPTVTDNCGVKDSTRSIETHFGSCINDRWIRRTWIFRDSCDNEGIIRQLIYVMDTIPPVVTRTWAEDTSYLECLSAVPPIQWPTVSDNCGIKDSTRSIETTFGSCINDRTIRRTWVFRDSCDNEGRIVQMIYVEDIIPPDVIVPWVEDTVRIVCASDIPILIEPTVSDNCGVRDTVFSRVISDSTCVNHFTLDRIWEYSDSCDNASLVRQVIIVNDDIPPITICHDTILELDENGLASIVPADLDGGTTDNCGEFSLSASQLIFDCSDIGENTVTLTATDTCNNASYCDAIVTVEDNIPPTVETDNIVIFLDANGYASITIGDILITAFDNCGIDEMFLSQTEFYCEDLGWNTITLTVIDNSGNVTIDEFIVTVIDNIAPELILQDIEVYLDENGFASITVDDLVVSSHDNCEITSLTLDNYMFYCSDIGDNVVYATAIDQSGNLRSEWATVTVIDSLAPVVVCIQDTTIEIPYGQPYYVVAGDEFDPLDMYDNCEITSDTNSFNGEPTLEGAEFPEGTTTVTWFVEDQSGNIGECAFNVTISVITEISDYFMGNVFIYPNPTHSAFKIDMGKTYDRVSMVIKDMNGKVLMIEEYELIEEIDLNIENYVNGMYFITLISNKKIGVYRIIKY